MVIKLAVVDRKTQNRKKKKEDVECEKVFNIITQLKIKNRNKWRSKGDLKESNKCKRQVKTAEYMCDWSLWRSKTKHLNRVKM